MGINHRIPDDEDFHTWRARVEGCSREVAKSRSFAGWEVIPNRDRAADSIIDTVAKAQPWDDLDTFMAEQQERIRQTLAGVDARREDRRWRQEWTGRDSLTEFEHRK